MVSETSRKFITNLLAATAARVVEEPGDSSEDSDDFEFDDRKHRAGSLDLIHQTLAGIANRSLDEGALGFGEHATTNRLGKALWQSAALDAEEEKACEGAFL